MSMPAAATTSRATSCSAARPPQAGAACRRSRPGMPLPAGTGLTRRSFLAALGRARARRLRRRALGSRALRGRASRSRRDAGRAARARLGLPRRRDRLALGALPGRRPAYYALRPTLALPPTAGHAVRRGRAAALAPVAAARSRRCTARARSPSCPAIGYDHPDQSHFTSRHYWEVGATDAQPPHRLARPLPRPRRRRRTTRCRASRSTTRLQPALATAQMPVASLDGADRYDFWPPGVWRDPLERPDARRGRRSSAPRTQSTRPGARARRARPRPVARASASSSRRSRDGITSPVPYPRSNDAFPTRLAGLAAMLAAGLPLRFVALHGARRATTRTRTRRTTLQHGPQADGATRCSPSSATSRRAGSPTACSSTSGRSSAGARRRTARAAPTTAPPGSAS